ncbi:hypothetical protein APA386B_289 [Acetobacter pasteurianus 386B]|nr:hypothetical protein APA386B_289 [Acetobacter pasteurianus 386B]
MIEESANLATDSAINRSNQTLFRPAVLNNLIGAMVPLTVDEESALLH